MNFPNGQFAEYPDDFGSPSTSSSSPQKSLVRPLCKVCGDIALGVNYGVLTCSGCKKFFQRTTTHWPPKQETCIYRTWNCPINPENRKKCPPCRLKKCVEAGMKRSWMERREGDPSVTAPDIVEENKENKESIEERDPRNITLAELNYGQQNRLMMDDEDDNSTLPESQGSQEKSDDEQWQYDDEDPGDFPAPIGDQSQTQTVQEFVENLPGYPNRLKTKRNAPVLLVHPELQNNGQNSLEPYWEQPPVDFSYLSEHSYAKRADEPYCTVCSEPASRSHLGVKACEKCTNSFAQYVLKARFKPRGCRTNGYNNGTCETCEYCHFQKCVRAGMRGRTTTQRVRSIENVHYPFCQVCGNRPTGVRFGAWSCDPCKFRFLRITTNGQYPKRCDNKGECPISSSSCLSCWFERCIDVGMWREGMELNPVPVEPEESNKEADDSAKIIWKYYETCAFTVPKMKNIRRKHYNMMTHLKDPYINRLNAWQMYSYEMAHDMQATGEFLRALPRLDEIEMEERVWLLKNNYFAIYLLNIYRGLSLRGMYLRDGRWIPLDVLELLFGEPLLRRILKFVDSYTGMECSDAETALAIPLILIQDEGESSEKLWELREYYDTLLSKNSSEKIYEFFEKLAPELDRITRNYYDVLGFVRDNVTLLNLCPYFMEMFDIQFPSSATASQITPDANVPVVIDLTCE